MTLNGLRLNTIYILEYIMNKSLKLALLPAAVASAMFANNALAGTEACFEVYKGADDLAVTEFGTIYTGASCIAEGSRTGAAADNLEQTDEGKIAYELTGNLPVSFDALDGTDTDQHIVYIPTTDIPGGTKITMKLAGAKFNGNANQIHLVKDTDGAGAGTAWEAVASSDGTVDGTDTVVFLTKAGITIGAGTRLAFSLASTGADAAALEPVGIILANDTCTTDGSSQSVTIQSVEAITDGGTGYAIEGGVSTAQKVLDVSPQFYAFQEGSTAKVDVNAESFDSSDAPITARTEFVYDPAAANQLVAKKYEAIYETAFYNRAGLLDRAVTLDADDHVDTTFTASSAAGATVAMRLYNAQNTATAALTQPVDAETGTTDGLLDGTSYATEAVSLFTASADVTAETNPHNGSTDNLDGAVYNKMFYVVTNTDVDGVMNFNYDVDLAHTLNFDDGGTDIDHCGGTIKSHEIGVNGAVLKVPYTYATWARTEGVKENWVRITNEHSESAEVTVEVFPQSAFEGETGTTSEIFTLGTVGGQDSAIYFAEDIALQYDALHPGMGNRFTFTFTVTAPKNSVHGVAVNKVGEADRVLPVLDQNDWKQ
jgi:hypothetical protein